MRSPLSSPAGFLFALAVLALACEGEVITNEFATGGLTVATTTAGEEPDPDGYTVQLDQSGPQPIGATGQVQFNGLDSGEHTVTLAGVAANCSAAEGLSRTVTVSEGSIAMAEFTLSCTADTGEPGGWSRIPLPTGVTAATGVYQGRTLWGTSPSDLFVIARATESSPRNSIWHYDGTGWSEQVSRVDTVFNGIWGLSGSDVFAVGNGNLFKPDPAPVILHYDGARWSEMQSPASGAAILSGLWGKPGAAFLGGRAFNGAAELVARFDGSAWSRLSLPVFGDFTEFLDLGGTSGTDVWAIGSRQTCEDCNHQTAMIVHFDGQSWTEQFRKNADVYTGVWAIAPNDVWVVGQNDEANANVLHYDGAGWTRADPLPPAENGLSENGLQDVWASAGNDVYAVGPGVLLHYDGSSWSKISDEGGDRVWGTSPNDRFILRANEIIHFKR